MPIYFTFTRSWIDWSRSRSRSFWSRSCRRQSRFTARTFRTVGRWPCAVWAGQTMSDRFVWLSQSRQSCQCQHTSSSRVKDVWRSRRHSFMNELYCRSVPRLISRERRSVIREAVWSDSLSWWDGRWSASHVVTVSSVVSSWLLWQQ